jgi:alpha-N-arabinofuranosidase
MRRFLFASVSALAFSLASPVADAAPPVKLSVDVSKPGPVIDRNIFGQFAEHLGHGIYDGIWVGKDSKIPNTRGIRNDVVQALKALQVPNVRWPGGCFADYYHWRRGIGPVRQPMMNGDWGGVVEPNLFGTDEFFDFIGQIGSQAYISVNVGSGTPGEAAEWLEYMTASKDDALGAERAKNGHPEPYKVAFVGLGNESWDCGGGMSPDYYVSEMKRYSRFVRNYHPDQTEKGQPMKRIAVGPGTADTAYTEAVMKAYSGHSWAWSIEGLSMHSYTTGGGWPLSQKSADFGEREYALMLSETVGMDSLIKKHGAIMDKYDPEKKVSLTVDEWGAWYVPSPGSNPGFLVQQNTQRDAVLAALNINIFARHADRVRMTNIAQMINVLQAMIVTDKEKMVLTPTYHVFKMYVPFQDATFIPLSYDAGKYTFEKYSLQRVDAIAARDRTGKIWLAITNVDPHQPAEFEISVPGVAATKAVGETLHAPKIDSANSFEAPKTVAPAPISVRATGGKLMLTLAPASVTVVALEP